MFVAQDKVGCNLNAIYTCTTLTKYNSYDFASMYVYICMSTASVLPPPSLSLLSSGPSTGTSGSRGNHTLGCHGQPPIPTSDGTVYCCKSDF